MNTPDPFQALGGERTIIKPRLGQAKVSQPGPEQVHEDWQRRAAQSTQTEENRLDELLGQFNSWPHASSNILLNETTPLIRLIIALGQTVHVQKPAVLAKSLTKALVGLEQALQSLHRPHTERLAVRYVLCAFSDERAACTPWGGNGMWAPHSQMLHFFSETWGGEKVFLLLEKMMHSPAENRDLLVLISVVLSLGFQGKYRVQAGGEQALEQLRMRLFQLIESTTTKPPAQLHPDFWRSNAPSQNAAFWQVPVWLPLAGLCLVASTIFFSFYFHMNKQSDSAFAQIALISFPRPELQETVQQAGQAVMGLELPIQLQQEIMNGQLTLRQKGNRSTVVLLGDGLFDSGSAELVAKALPLVDKVARELGMHPGQITVTGYTDNQPIRSIRFPSNWQLAAARAEHVGQRISALLPGIEVNTEGAGAANPIAGNDTPAGRSMNRRVEITLLHTL